MMVVGDKEIKFEHLGRRKPRYRHIIAIIREKTWMLKEIKGSGEISIRPETEERMREYILREYSSWKRKNKMPEF